MSAIMVQNGAREDPEVIELATLLARLATELRQSATVCTALQWSISTLLEKVHHPDLGEEIHLLQDIDRLQQTLADIAEVVLVASQAPSPAAISTDTIGNAIRLESFRRRIGLYSNSDSPAGDEDLSGPKTSDVTWF